MLGEFIITPQGGVMLGIVVLIVGLCLRAVNVCPENQSRKPEFGRLWERDLDLRFKMSREKL